MNLERLEAALEWWSGAEHYDGVPVDHIDTLAAVGYMVRSFPTVEMRVAAVEAINGDEAQFGQATAVLAAIRRVIFDD